MGNRIFRDRHEAGRALGDLVAALPDLEDGVVLGLVRGGVPVAFEVARACGLSLDVLIVRKLGVPGQPELAMGALASGGRVALNQEVLRAFRISETELAQIIENARSEILRRENLYRGEGPGLEFAGRAVVLVDDGMATGASMRAAVGAVRECARRVIVALPVGARGACDELRREADQVVCVLSPERMLAVSQFYSEFKEVTEEEVAGLVRQLKERQ